MTSSSISETPVTDQPGDQASLAGIVAGRIAKQIAEGRLAPGSWIREISLAESLGVSRSPVREALRRLAAEGLVDAFPRRGSRVVQLSREDGCEHYDCRLIIEPVCYRMAIEVVSDGDLTKLAELVSLMKAAVREKDSETYARLDVDYHRALAHMCPNKTLVDLLELTWRKVLCYRYLILRGSGRAERSLEMHLAFQEAVERRDATEVEKLSRELLIDARKALVIQLS